MSQYNLTDFEWRVIEPPLPNSPQAGRTIAGDKSLACVRGSGKSRMAL